jgi:hypothetical protein
MLFQCTVKDVDAQTCFSACVLTRLESWDGHIEAGELVSYSVANSEEKGEAIIAN